MVSLRVHLREPSRHPDLPFHPDCPHCRAGCDANPTRTSRSRRSRTALAATLLAGSALTAAGAVPVAHAQDEEETEGTEELDGSDEASPEFEDAPEDAEAEREELDVLPEPETPDSLMAPPDETGQRGPAGTAPGVLNAPAPMLAPTTPPAPPLPPPAAEGPPAQRLERPLGQQPKPPERRPRIVGFRVEPRTAPRQPAPDDGGLRTPRSNGPEGLGPPTTDGPSLPPRPGATSLGSGPAPPGEDASHTRRGRRAAYRVQAGDSLWSIAEARLGPRADAGDVAREVAHLWALNASRIDTGDPDLIMPDTVLRLR